MTIPQQGGSSDDVVSRLRLGIDLGEMVAA